MSSVEGVSPTLFAPPPSVSPTLDRDFAAPNSPVGILSPPPDYPNPTRPRAGTAATIQTLEPVNEHRGSVSRFSRRDSSTSTFRLRRTQTLKPSSDYAADTFAGAEPGLDVGSEGLTDRRIQSLRGPCQITVVEYSEDCIDVKEFNNEDFQEFLKFLNEPREEWVKVRWINCNGEKVSMTLWEIMSINR